MEKFPLDEIELPPINLNDYCEVQNSGQKASDKSTLKLLAGEESMAVGTVRALKPFEG